VNTAINENDAEISVVVALIEGGREATETCLEALYESARGVRLECILPFDARLDHVDELKAKFPWVDFVDSREHVDAEEFGSKSREHHDILRAIGLRLSTAPIVALLEDHGTPSASWAPAVLEAHRRSSAAVIGGAVENGMDRILNWAVYYCDFGRYQNPVPAGDVEFASDSNVSYKCDALMSVKDQWYNAFHETSVNWELRRRGETLILNPDMVVHQTRRRLRFWPALNERFVWGRSFAGTRAVETSSAKRLIFAALSFVLPFVLTVRILLQGLGKKRFVKQLIIALPLVFFLQIFWATGEFVGYVTGRAEGGAGERTGKSRQLGPEPAEN
jgi:hypothetical protein